VAYLYLDVECQWRTCISMLNVSGVLVFRCWMSVAYLYLDVECESSWNVMVHGDAREGKWRGNWRLEWVASTLHTTSEHGVSSITTADAHTSASSNRLNWRPGRFKWTRSFRRKTKSGFWACAIAFQTRSSTECSALTSWSITECYHGIRHCLYYRNSSEVLACLWYPVAC